MSPQFSMTEQKIIDLLQHSKSLNFNGISYSIQEVDKPTTPKGEPKTDIYVLLQDQNENDLEIKISVKQSNADFLENKIKAERAKEIFGDTWKEIIEELTASIKQEFLNKKIVFLESDRKTEKGSITLGWKFEITNKSGGELSGLLPKKLLKEVLTGEGLEEDKKNAYVNGKRKKNSGIANYILEDAEVFSLKSIDQVFASLKSIDEYVQDEKNQIYFVCKALNYRTKPIDKDTKQVLDKHKWDGPRPLCVHIKWKNCNSKLDYEFCFNEPLLKKGNEIAKMLSQVLSELNIKNTDDISSSNFPKLK